LIEIFHESSNGDLFVVNGIDPVLRWDGFSSQMEEAGLSAPTSAVTLSDFGVGQIVGTYWAYLRFVDALGNVSNFGPISAEFEAQGASGTITGCTAETPIVVTSTAHGLTTGTWVKIDGVGGIDTANDTWQITVIDADSFSLDESSSDGVSTYTGGGTWQSGVATISYSSVQTPAESKVVRRQILRNTDGQATTFYVDVDTTDLSSTTLSSTRIDTDLASQESVPLLDSNGQLFANRHDKPLSFFSGITQHLDRMFMCGTVDYTLGHCQVVFGSATVTGIGTDWKTTFDGRFLYVQGADKAYEIDSVNEPAQTLTMTEAYLEDSDEFAFYSIKPSQGYRRLVVYSEPGLPESWPATNAISVQDTGDDLIGPMQSGSFVFILERRHIHKMTFTGDPSLSAGGGVYMIAQRGCVNNRCWVKVDSDAYMLDEIGIHRFSAGEEPDPLSLQIQDLFRDGDSGYRIDWRWKQYFFAVLDRQREIIRWYVSLDGSRYPGHAIAYHWRLKRWWVESSPCLLGGACTGYLGGQEGMPQVFTGGEHKRVFASWTGTLDHVNPDDGTVRGTVTSSTAFTLTDSSAAFPSTGIVNTPVIITRGLGKGQRRRIVSFLGGVLTVDRPWFPLPDTTSQYQIGGIPWSYKGMWMRLTDDEKMADNRIEILFEPAVQPATCDLLFYSDFSGYPDNQAVTQISRDGAGIECTKGRPELIIDLKRPVGLVDRRFPDHKEYFIQGRRYLMYALEGVSALDQARVYQIVYEGAAGQ
jgi:hypothetical protein